MLAFQNVDLIKRHNIVTASSSPLRAKEENYTSSPPRPKRRDKMRLGSKQAIKPSSKAKNGKMKQERTVVIMYHKPPNVITSHSNAGALAKTHTEQTRCTVYEDIYTMKGFVADQSKTGKEISFEAATNIQSKLHAIGRLDAATTGLLLLTNDGNLVHQVTNPNAKIDNEQSKSVQKTYEALIMGHHELPEASTTISENNDGNYPLVTLLEKGATLSPKHGGQTKPVDALTILSHPTASTTLVSITISEGKNRQIRRMFHSIGSGVMKLHRVSVGELSLAGLASSQTTEMQVGEWRLLSEDEIRLGLGWECRWLDEVSQVNGGRLSRVSGQREFNTRKTTKRRRRR
eukprot:scaffold16886_cov148-Skeletonema_menzelii.AAC.3